MRKDEAYSLYSVKDGLVLWKDKQMVPNKEDIIKKILTGFHTSHIGGHA
jgi:hypothetical protein